MIGFQKVSVLVDNPSFTRRLTHNGEEWSFTRVRSDGVRWISTLRKSLIRERTWRENHASEMNDLPHWHRKLRARTLEPDGLPPSDPRRREVRAGMAHGCTGGVLIMFGTYCRLRVPVWSTDREVIRAARRILAARARRGRELRAERHAFYRQMLDFHHCEQELVREYRL